MIGRRQEKFWFHLSRQLGIELCLVGVGKKKFIPEQDGTAAAFETRDTGLAEWQVAAIDRPDEQAWWVHTHPTMNAFISSDDVYGAHVMYDLIRRPFTAVVLGKYGSKFVEQITQQWLTKNPCPKEVLAQPASQVVTFRHPFYLPPYRQQAALWMPPHRSPEDTLKWSIAYMIQKYGATTLYDELDRQVQVTYSDRKEQTNPWNSLRL